ncbi:MAG: decarboxylating 6-phosphogluconate dehydrogenase [Candidatus Eisenbacteria bacterium]|nr:decarboxylating 6-phosphogluconate dehydrogenase [Candidatus Eisenbacteria bacterium]
MTIGLIGLGRMGKNMALRLLAGGHHVVGLNRSPEPYAELIAAGGASAGDLDDLLGQVQAPRVLWCMVPSGLPTETLVAELISRLSPGDVIVDGGNSNFHDSVRRAGLAAARDIHFLDAGTSGGIWGRTVGYCLMVGGSAEAFAIVQPALATLAPPDGYQHVGASGAGHYAKMVHNAIEYGMMQAYGEGFELLSVSGYDFDLEKLSHLWNQGSVVRSWLLELAERAFAADPGLATLSDHVDDSGEGRWTLIESIDKAVPMPVLALALQARFRSRQDSSFSGRVLAALRREFGGHAVQPTVATPVGPASDGSSHPTGDQKK